MAIIPSSRYSGQIDTGDANYPQGKAKNVAVSGDGTGTPLEADWVNDLFGMFQAFLASAGITPSGTPEQVGLSQFVDAFNARIGTDRSLESVTGNMMSGAWAKRRLDVTSQAPGAREAIFGKDGDRLYVLNFGALLSQYDLSTPYDETTETFIDTLGTGVELYNARGFDWKPDGTRVYFGGMNASNTAEAKIAGYPCSTAWELSSATSGGSDQSYICALFANGGVTGVKFAPDGTKVFISGYTPSNVWLLGEFDVSTPWDVSTASVAQQVIAFTDAADTGGAYVENFDISEDGKTVFAVCTYAGAGSFPDYILYEAELASAYSLTGAVFQERYRNLDYPGDGQIRSISFAVGDDSRAAAVATGNGAGVMSMYTSAVRVGA